MPKTARRKSVIDWRVEAYYPRTSVARRPHAARPHMYNRISSLYCGWRCDQLPPLTQTVAASSRRLRVLFTRWRQPVQ